MILFENLTTSDLIRQEIYRGGTTGNQKDAVISKIFSVRISGGFRYRGKAPNNLSFIVLYSSGEHIVWQDRFDNNEGVYIYYGDNDSHKNKINETNSKGNLILETIFANVYEKKRNEIPPIFIFQKVKGRDMKFVGLGVPVSETTREAALKIVKRRDEKGNLILNYEARFTLLNEEKINRRWIDDIINGNIEDSKFTPVSWMNWRKGDAYSKVTEIIDSNLEFNYEERLEATEILAYYLARFGEDNCSKLFVGNLAGLKSFVHNYLNFEKKWFLKITERYREFLSNENMKKMKNPPKNIYGIVTQYDSMNNLAVVGFIDKMMINIIEGRHDLKVPLILKEEIADSFKAEYTTAKTGKAAEDLFVSWYKAGLIPELKKYKDIEIDDTRLTDLGYDFSMKESPGYLFEVKGLKSSSGGVRFTQNEWEQAEKLKEKYFLIFIYDLDWEPKCKVVRNPFNSLSASLNEQYVKQISWHITKKEIMSVDSIDI